MYHSNVSAFISCPKGEGRERGTGEGDDDGDSGGRVGPVMVVGNGGCAGVDNNGCG